VGRTIIDPLLIHQKISRKGARKKAETAMEEVGLSTRLFEELPGSLSAGERQRISIARALVLEPEIMILDETLTSLDHGEQNALLGLFGELQKNYNFTYIFISHDLAMVRRACDRVAVMYLGEIVELGDTEQIFELPTHPYTQALLSALATLEDKPFRQEDCLLDGEPPSPVNLPSGCSFANRCPHAFERCQVENPGLTPNSTGGMRACHLAVSKLLPKAAINKTRS
jgi:peptide/nickel transport system ATP-binding protein